MYEDLKGSGLLQQTRDSDNRTKVLGALDELVSRGVLVRYTNLERKEGQKWLMSNIRFTLPVILLKNRRRWQARY